MSLIERDFREKIVLVGEIKESLDELARLINTAGADEMGRLIVRRERPDPATFIGAGKAEELHMMCLAVDADTAVFDDELTPAQQRNLEKILGRTAIDRTAVILDIFAQNAHTQEGKAQVELALLRYRLPRLRGRGVALSQQAGRIGTRGPGETQLETDRRRLQRRITKLEHELTDLRQRRSTQRKARQRSRLHQIAFVGYTNAGKSTLLNRLTSAEVLVENKLFSTLDPATRRLALPGGEVVLASDTVGFVRKLPHELVEAFRSTLEEVREADLLVHVVDVSQVDAEDQIAAVNDVLTEINAIDVPQFVVLNKFDLVETPEQKTNYERLLRVYEDAVTISAATGEGIDQFLETLAERLRARGEVLNLFIPYDRGDIVAAAHREGEVLTEDHTDDGTRLTLRIDSSSAASFQNFIV
jgi:GTP-binding protein HflX